MLGANPLLTSSLTPKPFLILSNGAGDCHDIIFG